MISEKDAQSAKDKRVIYFIWLAVFILGIGYFIHLLSKPSGDELSKAAWEKSNNEWLAKVETFSPRECGDGTDTHLYIAVGRTVLALPPEMYRYDGRIQLDLEEKGLGPTVPLLPTRRPDQHLGCEGNPFQLFKYSISADSPIGRTWEVPFPLKFDGHHPPPRATLLNGYQRSDYAPEQDRIKRDDPPGVYRFWGSYGGLSYELSLCDNINKTFTIEKMLKFSCLSNWDRRFIVSIWGGSVPSEYIVNTNMHFSCCSAYDSIDSRLIGSYEVQNKYNHDYSQSSDAYLTYSTEAMSPMIMTSSSNLDAAPNEARDLVKKIINYDTYARNRVLSFVVPRYQWPSGTEDKLLKK